MRAELGNGGRSYVRKVLEHEQRRAFFRAVTCMALTARDKRDPAQVLRKAWGGDRNAEILLKAARPPIGTSDFVAVESVRSLALLAPKSAAVRLFEAGIQLDLTGVNRVRVPNVSTAPQAAWVAEGAPAPALAAILGSTFLGPVRKILILAALTSELETSGPENASAVIGSILSAAASRLIDSTAFGTGAGDAATPAGLLHNVTPLTPATATGQATYASAAAADLGNMAAAMANAGVDPEGAVIIASVKQAITMRFLAGPSFANVIYGSTGLPANTVVLAQPAAIASATDGVPQVEVGAGSAVVHMADPAAPIVDGATASPVTSLYQQDMIGVKCRAPCAWVVTTPGGIQWVQTVAW
jgi:capsid protein